MSKVRAKFKCTEKNENEGGFSLTFYPVTSGSAENERFYHYTPAGQVQLSTINAEAAAGFAVGAEYYVDFTPAENSGDSA